MPRKGQERDYRVPVTARIDLSTFVQCVDSLAKQGVVIEHMSRSEIINEVIQDYARLSRENSLVDFELYKLDTMDAARELMTRFGIAFRTNDELKEALSRIHEKEEKEKRERRSMDMEEGRGVEESMAAGHPEVPYEVYSKLGFIDMSLEEFREKYPTWSSLEKDLIEAGIREE